VSEPCADRGFTLIEVLVALAIVVVGMAAVMGALTSSASTAAYLRDKTFAQWVALNQIANLRLSGQQPPTGKSDGNTDFAGRTWHWHQEVVTTELPGVERIDVSVRPADLKVSSDDRSWVTTVSGIWGDAVGTPNGWQPDWGSQTLGGSPAGPGGSPAASLPGAPTTPPGGGRAPVTTPNPTPTPSPRGTQ
jgi:general secretion pathway protein I